MAGEVVFTAHDFKRLSQALRDAGEKGLRRELNTGLRQAAAPLVDEVRASAREVLPHSGGLGEFIATKPVGVRTRTGREPGVVVVINHQDPRLDDGRLVHPVYNRHRLDGTRVTVVQQVAGGVFTRAAALAGLTAFRAVQQSLGRFLDDLERRL